LASGQLMNGDPVTTDEAAKSRLPSLPGMLLA
jgi:hypothetical protein